MNAENSNRFFKIVIVLLIIINAMVLVLHFRPTNSRPPEGKHGRGPALKNKLINDLNMDEGQVASYSEMVDRHRAAMNEIHKQEDKTRTALYANFGTIQPNKDSLLNEMGNIRRNSEVITMDHFLELRTILDAQQTKKFDEIIGEAVNGL